MEEGFIKVAAATPKIQVADCRANVSAITEEIKAMEEEGAKIMVLPELCMTGYTCSDLFWQQKLLKDAREGLRQLEEVSRDIDALIFLGLPLEKGGKLYNVAAGLHRGKLLGLTPKRYLPLYFLQETSVLLRQGMNLLCLQEIVHTGQAVGQLLLLAQTGPPDLSPALLLPLSAGKEPRQIPQTAQKGEGTAHHAIELIGVVLI